MPALFSDARHGPLPGLLLGLTVVTGLVDAVSILSLGRVFVANMTGNVAFIGFALAGAPGFSLAASLSALAGFLVGAGIGGPMVQRFKSNRGRLLWVGASVECACAVVALVLVATAPSVLPAGIRDGSAAVLGLALGLQNAVVRSLGVPDLTTTVLTMTLTGLAADVRAGPSVAAGRRLLAVAAMLGGAAVGAVVVLNVSTVAAIAIAAGGLALVSGGAGWASRGDRLWHSA